MNTIRMRRPILAVQWDPASVDYVVAERKAGKVTIVAAGSVARTHGEDEPEVSPGEILGAELQRLGVRRPITIVALGRGNVDVIPLQLPPAGESELPTLVANQVVRDAGDVAETGIIDYVTLDTPEGQPREVFAFVVDTLTIDHVVRELSKAGLKPCSIVYRPLASVTALKRMVPQSRRTMILATLHDREADLSIVRNGRLVYTRTARLSETKNVGDIAAQLAVEVRRSLAAASLPMDAEEQHLYVFGALQESEQLVQELAEELSLPASLLDPLRMEHVVGPTPESVGRLSPLLGMVYEHFGATHPLDFLHPKQPPPPPNYYRRAAFYAAAVLVLAAVGLYVVWDANAKADEEIAGIRSTLEKTTAQLEKVKQKQSVVDAVWEWRTDNVNWLDELYDLARRFPSGRDAIIRRFSISLGRGGQTFVDLTVQVRDPDVISQLGDNLRDAYHDVRSKGVSEQTSSADYPWQFDTRITLRKRDVEEYRKRAPAEPGQGDVAAREEVRR